MKRFVNSLLLVAAGCAALSPFTRAPQALASQKEHKVAICHGTASAKNPYVLIIVDESAKATHLDGHGQNNAPDFALNGGNVLTLEQEIAFRKQGDSACGCPMPIPGDS